MARKTWYNETVAEGDHLICIEDCLCGFARAGQQFIIHSGCMRLHYAEGRVGPFPGVLIDNDLTAEEFVRHFALMT